jgi:putative salt-induced outer membrane protein YdiY
MSQPQTIQSSLPSDPTVRYIDTVHAYDQWANVSTTTPALHSILI